MTDRQAAARVFFMLAMCTMAQCHFSACGDNIEDAIEGIDKRDLTNLTPDIEWGEEPDAGCESDAGTDGGCDDAGMEEP